MDDTSTENIKTIFIITLAAAMQLMINTHEYTKETFSFVLLIIFCSTISVITVQGKGQHVSMNCLVFSTVTFYAVDTCIFVIESNKFIKRWKCITKVQVVH